MVFQRCATLNPFIILVFISGHTVNSFLNKNALEIVAELNENIGDSLAYVFMKVMNDAFGRIPTKFWLTAWWCWMQQDSSILENFQSQIWRRQSQKYQIRL